MKFSKSGFNPDVKEFARFEKLVTGVIIEVPTQFFKLRDSQEIWKLRQRLQEVYSNVDCIVNEELITYSCDLDELPTVSTIDELMQLSSEFRLELLEHLLPTYPVFDVSLEISVSTFEIEE
jgi:short-subunit dehydrogenase involved in D-alanine esterification of teichoic acids